MKSWEAEAWLSREGWTPEPGGKHPQWTKGSTKIGVPHHGSRDLSKDVVAKIRRAIEKEKTE